MNQKSRLTDLLIDGKIEQKDYDETRFALDDAAALAAQVEALAGKPEGFAVLERRSSGRCGWSWRHRKTPDKGNLQGGASTD